MPNNKYFIGRFRVKEKNKFIPDSKREWSSWVYEFKNQETEKSYFFRNIEELTESLIKHVELDNINPLKILIECDPIEKPYITLGIENAELVIRQRGIIHDEELEKIAELIESHYYPKEKKEYNYNDKMIEKDDELCRELFNHVFGESRNPNGSLIKRSNTKSYLSIVEEFPEGFDHDSEDI